jgi:hypothetical protein
MGVYQFSIFLRVLSRLDFANAKSRDEFAVLDNILVSQISLESSALTDKHEETSATVEVLLVGLQVIGDLQDSSLKNSDLHLRRTRVALSGGEVRDRLLLDVRI